MEKRVNRYSLTKISKDETNIIDEKEENIVNIQTDEIYISPEEPIPFITQKIESVKNNTLIERKQQFPMHDKYNRPLLNVQNCIVTDCCGDFLHSDSTRKCEVCEAIICPEHRYIQNNGKYRCESCDDIASLKLVIKGVASFVFGSNTKFFNFF